LAILVVRVEVDNMLTSSATHLVMGLIARDQSTNNKQTNKQSLSLVGAKASIAWCKWQLQICQQWQNNDILFALQICHKSNACKKVHFALSVCLNTGDGHSTHIITPTQRGLFIFLWLGNGFNLNGWGGNDKDKIYKLFGSCKDRD
jgi:hypothetical protein